MSYARTAGALALLLLGTSVASCLPRRAAAQTIDGTLLDLDTGQPINLGLILMFTEAGDSVDMTVSDEAGRFSISADEPGNFVLLASALGYRETPAGVFELGADGVMTVQYRIAPEPLALDALLVSLDRPVLQHKLVRNGFVRRFQRGLGFFITPHDIEESVATSTEDLLMHVPSVRVSDVRVNREFGGVTFQLPRPEIGETVQIRGQGGGWCTPTVYVDGARSFYSPDATSTDIGVTLSMLAPLSTVDAIEVYRRPAEIPVEYAAGAFGTDNDCGVLVVWTKGGPAAGQRALGTGVSADFGGGAAGSEGRPLPRIEEQGPPPTQGERIRLQLAAGVSQRLGLRSPWEGTFLTVRGGDLVATDPAQGRPVAVPMGGVEVLQVERARRLRHALRRGGIVGGAFGVGVWQFLNLLCRFSECEGASLNTWLPATATGLVVGTLIAFQGPGTRWVEAPLPEAGSSPGGTR